jgi:hypothetical protein
MLPLSSSMLSNSPKLSISSIALIMGARQLRSIMTPLSAREESSFVGITWTSHGGSSYNDPIVANIKTLNVPRK